MSMSIVLAAVGAALAALAALCFVATEALLALPPAVW
jgi:hypothetical protein